MIFESLIDSVVFDEILGSGSGFAEISAKVCLFWEFILHYKHMDKLAKLEKLDILNDKIHS